MEDVRLKYLIEMRNLTESFISGEISFVDYFTKISNILGDEFDPMDWEIEGLPKNVQIEILFYSKWTGGEFGETDHLIPKRDDWVYGKDLEPYSWINQKAYQKNLSEAYYTLRKQIDS